MKRAVLAAALLLALAACADPPTSGTVEHRQHSAAYTYQTHPCLVYTNIRTGNGMSISVCSVYGTDTWHRPEEWGLCLKHDKQGESDGCLDVDREVYLKYPEGTHYP